MHRVVCRGGGSFQPTHLQNPDPPPGDPPHFRSLNLRHDQSPHLKRHYKADDVKPAAELVVLPTKHPVPPKRDVEATTDRSGWASAVIARNPALADMLDRVNPLSRSAAIFQLRDLVGAQIESRAFTRQEALRLVADFLESEGIPLAAELVAAELDAPDQTVGTGTQLYALMHAAVVAAEKVKLVAVLSMVKC